MDSLLNKVLIKSFVAQDLYCCTVKVAIKSLENASATYFVELYI